MFKTTLDNSTIPLVEAVHYGGRQRPTAILLRTSWTTDNMGAANGIAQAWHNPNTRRESCHYVVDDTQVIRCVPDRVQAYSTYLGGVKGAISINVCHNPPCHPKSATMANLVQLTAKLCKHYHIPVRFLSYEQEMKWRKHGWKRHGGLIMSSYVGISDENFLAAVAYQHSSL